MKKIYLAGSLFNEAEVAQRKLEGKLLRDNFKDKIKVFNPIEEPFNDNKDSLPSPNLIFLNDTKEVIAADIFLADITNNDPGVMVELGIAISNKKYIIAIISDIRLKTANKYDIPTYGFNHYVLGGILENGVLVYSFDEAMEKIKDYLKEK
jgi:nucleoside 2-deoxyribosyltransferase family protein